jgi:hypothetical protein
MSRRGSASTTRRRVTPAGHARRGGDRPACPRRETDRLRLPGRTSARPRSGEERRHSGRWCARERTNTSTAPFARALSGYDADGREISPSTRRSDMRCPGRVSSALETWESSGVNWCSRVCRSRDVDRPSGRPRAARQATDITPNDRHLRQGHADQTATGCRDDHLGGELPAHGPPIRMITNIERGPLRDGPRERRSGGLIGISLKLHRPS